MKKKILRNILGTVLIGSGVIMSASLFAEKTSFEEKLNVISYDNEVKDGRVTSYDDPMFQYIVDNFDMTTESNSWGVYQSPWKLDIQHTGADFNGDGNVEDEYWYGDSSGSAQYNDEAVYDVEEGFSFNIGIKFDPTVDVITNDLTATQDGEGWQQQFFVDRMPSPDYITVETEASLGSYIWGYANGTQYGGLDFEWVWTDGTPEGTTLEGLSSADASSRGYWKANILLNEGWDIMPGFNVAPVVYDNTLNTFQYTWDGLYSLGYGQNPWSDSDIYVNEMGNIYDGSTLHFIELSSGSPIYPEYVSGTEGIKSPWMTVPKMMTDAPTIDIATSITSEGVTFFTTVYADSETEYYHSNKDINVLFYPTIEDPETAMFTAEAAPLVISNYELVVDNDKDNSTFVGEGTEGAGKEFFTWEEMNGGAIAEDGSWADGSAWLSGRIEIVSSSTSQKFKTSTSRYTWALGTIDAEGIDEIIQMMVDMTIDGAYNEEIMNSVDTIIEEWYTTVGEDLLIEVINNLQSKFDNGVLELEDFVTNYVYDYIANIFENEDGTLNEDIVNKIKDEIQNNIDTIFTNEETLSAIKGMIIAAVEATAGQFVQEWVIANQTALEQMIRDEITRVIEENFEGVGDAVTIIWKDWLNNEGSNLIKDTIKDEFVKIQSEMFDNHIIYDRKQNISYNTEDEKTVDELEEQGIILIDETFDVEGTIEHTTYWDFNSNGIVDYTDGIYETNVVVFEEDLDGDGIPEEHLGYDFNWDGIADSKSTRDIDLVVGDDSTDDIEETEFMLTSNTGLQIYEYLYDDGLEEQLESWVDNYILHYDGWEDIFALYDNDTLYLILGVVGTVGLFVGAFGTIIGFSNKRKIKALEFAIAGGAKPTKEKQITKSKKESSTKKIDYSKMSESRLKEEAKKIYEDEWVDAASKDEILELLTKK